jgi:phosphate transport system protein
VPEQFTVSAEALQPSPDLVAEGFGQIDRELIRLFALVGEGLAGATHALLAGDRETARSLAESDEIIDELYRNLEELTFKRLTHLAAHPQELRFLVAVLRMLPELERSGDLVEHIARRAARGLGVERMGEVASEMWRAAADAYADRRAGAEVEIEALDDELDELHVALTAEIASGSMALPVAIEGALISRFYERLGDHAVNISRRIAALTGTRTRPGSGGPATGP